MFEKRSVYVITGAYGTGKALIAQDAGRKLNMKVGRAYSTCRSWAEREMDFHTVSTDDLVRLNETLSYIDVFGNDCAISIDELEAADIFIAEPAAAECIRSCYTGNSCIKIVYIAAPADQRKERLIRRGMTSRKIEEIFQAEAKRKEPLSIRPDAELKNDITYKKGFNPFAEYILRTAIASDEEVKKLAYGVYSSEWLLEHGITLPDIIDTVSGWIAEAYGGYSAVEIRAILWRGLMRRSYAGEHFLAFEEFLSGPYKDEYYRDRLLSRMSRRYHMVDFRQQRKDEIAAEREA